MHSFPSVFIRFLADAGRVLGAYVIPFHSVLLSQCQNALSSRRFQNKCVPRRGGTQGPWQYNYKHSTKGRGWMFGIIQFLFRHLMEYFQDCNAQMLPENFINVKGMKVSYHVTCERCHPSHKSLIHLAKSHSRRAEEGRSRQAWFLVLSDTQCTLLLNLFQYKLPYSGLTKQL